MTREIWLNLPVKDVSASKAFFTKLGFEFNDQFGGNGDESACLIIGIRKVVIMLFSEAMFERFTGTRISDTNTSSELLISIDAESREEVDEMAKRAADAGGNVFSAPADNAGWMYGCGFADLDGHRWNVLYMDMSQMPME